MDSCSGGESKKKTSSVFFVSINDNSCSCVTTHLYTGTISHTMAFTETITTYFCPCLFIHQQCCSHKVHNLYIDRPPCDMEIT